jgi:hypothetical protein
LFRVDFVSYEQPEMEGTTKRRCSIRFKPAFSPAGAAAVVTLTTPDGKSPNSPAKGIPGAGGLI